MTGSDAPVRREEVETAAVVTRVAKSFLRFGHFEHFSYNEQYPQLQQLADYTIDRYYPECRGSDQFAGNPYALLLQQRVSERTAVMVAHWQAVGFCHGVMNTDNMSMLGLTIDYGPFQFLDGYHPGHICNHSDHQGRYALQQATQHRLLEPVRAGPGAAAADRGPGTGHCGVGILQNAVPRHL